MARLEFSAGVTAKTTLERAFDYFADYRHVADVLEGVSRWEPSGSKSRGAGARFTVEMAVLGLPLKNVLRLDRWRRPDEIGWVSESGLIKQEGGFRFKQVAGGRRIDLDDHVAFCREDGYRQARSEGSFSRRRRVGSRAAAWRARGLRPPQPFEPDARHARGPQLLLWDGRLRPPQRSVRRGLRAGPDEAAARVDAVQPRGAAHEVERCGPRRRRTVSPRASRACTRCSGGRQPPSRGRVARVRLLDRGWHASRPARVLGGRTRPGQRCSDQRAAAPRLPGRAGGRVAPSLPSLADGLRLRARDL